MKTETRLNHNNRATKLLIALLKPNYSEEYKIWNLVKNTKYVFFLIYFSETPLNATITFTILAAIIAMTFDLDALVDFLSIGELVQHGSTVF